MSVLLGLKGPLSKTKGYKQYKSVTWAFRNAYQ